MGYNRSVTIKEWPPSADLDGFVVTVRRLTVGEVDELTSLDGIETMKGFVTAMPRLAEIFADVVEEWNLERRGKPLPVTAEVIAMQDQRLLDHLFAALLRVSVTPRAPLSQPSDDGATFLEASIPMEPSSPNLPSSPELDAS